MTSILSYSTQMPKSRHTNLIRQKIIAAIDKLEVNNHLPQKKYLLYLPEGETHEISLLFLAFLLKKRNNRITYLGANVPLGDVVSVALHSKPDYTCSIFTTNPTDSLQSYINHLADNAPQTDHLFAGQRLAGVQIDMPTNCTHIKSIQSMLDFINSNSVTIHYPQTTDSSSPNFSNNATDFSFGDFFITAVFLLPNSLINSLNSVSKSATVFGEGVNEYNSKFKPLKSALKRSISCIAFLQ